MILFLIGSAVILSGAFCALTAPAKIKTLISFISISAGAVLCSAGALYVLIRKTILSFSFTMSYPFGEVSLSIDALSAFFIILISVGAILASAFSCGYLIPYRNAGKKLGSHLFFFNTMIASMLLLVTVNHTIFFLVVWEVMSLSSLILILFERDKKEVIRAGIYYATAMHAGAACLIAGFALCAAQSSNFEISSLQTILAAKGGISRGAFILLITGFAVKAGFLPFHSWLPRAHPAAPSHVSALMSGVMIKMGIYGIIRVLSLSGTPEMRTAFIFILIAVITALFGVLSALVSRDMKKLLAYSSIENMGIIGCGIGAALLGWAAGNTGALHLTMAGVYIFMFSHMLAKSALFFTAGTVYLHTHTRDMESLGGLAACAPKTALSAFCSSAAISALPPFSLFIGELLMIGGFVSCMTAADPALSAGMIALISVFGLVGAMALFTFTKYTAIPFLGHPRKGIMITEKASLYMTVPTLAAPAILLLCGVFPQILFKLFSSTVTILSGSSAVDLMRQTSATLDSYSHAVLLLVLFSAAFLFLRFFLLRGRIVTKKPTWGCGYQGSDVRIQYTGHSFIQPFAAITGSLSGMKHVKELPQGFFPKIARFAAKGTDTVDDKILTPSLLFIDTLFSRAVKMQTGRIQIAILYGMLFIIAALSWSLLRGE